jgi:hypothetical protein
VLCAPGSPWHRWRLPCIEHTRVASAASCARSSYRTAWRCPPSLTSPLHLVPRHPFQASSPVGQRSWRYYPTLLTNSISSHFCATRESLKLGSSLLFLGSKFRQTPARAWREEAPLERERENEGAVGRRRWAARPSRQSTPPRSSPERYVAQHQGAAGTSPQIQKSLLWSQNSF